MTDEDPLVEHLKSYEQARNEEFVISTKGTSEEVAEKAREKLALLLPEASNELLHILRVGNKDDAVRLQAVKLVFEYTLGKPAPKGTKESDTDKIIKSLMSESTEQK
jgi:hydroxylamine reductase (hybrid-cluster protein)